MRMKWENEIRSNDDYLVLDKLSLKPNIQLKNLKEEEDEEYMLKEEVEDRSRSIDHFNEGKEYYVI